MSRIYFIFSLLVSSWAFSQSQLHFAKELHIDLSKVSLWCEGKKLETQATIHGLEFQTSCSEIRVQIEGYEDQVLKVEEQMQSELSLDPLKEAKIESVVIKDQSDPKALELLNKVREHYKQNSPYSLDMFRYRSYEKISLDLDKDSLLLYQKELSAKRDTISLEAELKAKGKEKKSPWTVEEMQQIARDSKGFLWERVLEYRHSKTLGEKTLVLDNRISGFSEPLYRLLAIRSDRSLMPKVLQGKNRNLYRFFLTDTLFYQGRETYEISFREIRKSKVTSSPKYNGRILIDAQSYGVRQIERESSSQSKRTLVSSWKLLQGKWFPNKEDVEIKIGELDLAKDSDSLQNSPKFGYYAFFNATYFDWQPNVQFEKQDFKGYEFEVKNSDGTLLPEYRANPLSSREAQTYVKIDSIGQKHNWNRAAGFISTLTSGKLRLGKVDLLAEHFALYSKYEGLRLGVGAKLNEHFSPHWSPEAYIGYGFRDQKWKYGFAVDYLTSLSRHSKLRAEYYSDVKASGLFNEELWSFKMKLMNSGVNISNKKYFSTRGAKLSWEYDLRPNLTMKLGVERERNEALFPYDFKTLGDAFDEFGFQATLKYAPGSKSMMTPGGKFTYHSGFPEIYLHYKQGLSILGGETEFKKIELLFTHQFKNPWGLTGTRAYMGKVFGDAPIWNHFQMNGLSGEKLKTSFTLTSYLGFATMPGGQYYNDRFVGYYLTHRLPWYFKSIGHNSSSIDVLYKGIIGDMSSPQNHELNFQPLNKLYQEVGLEWNNFLSSHFNLGFFYRVGHYHTPGFKGNFAVQLKLKLLGF